MYICFNKRQQTLKNIFLYLPRKRPYTEDCQEHRWLMASDYMVKKRERAHFLGNRLKVALSDSFKISNFLTFIFIFLGILR